MAVLANSESSDQSARMAGLGLLCPHKPEDVLSHGAPQFLHKWKTLCKFN